MTHVEKAAKKRACIEQLVARIVKGEKKSEESIPKSASELDTEDLMSKCMGQVCHKEPLIH
jgi:hypothetical protein